MKRLIYKVAYIVAVVMVIASSCTKQDLREEPSLTSKNPIEVRSYSVGSGTQVHTKSAIYGSTMPTDRDLVISAYYNAADEGTDAEFFKNYLFSYSSVKQTWTSAEKPAYWPLKGTLDFLAYSSEDAQLSAEWNTDNCADEVILGSFKESLGLSDDLLYAKANGQTYSASGVPMEFRHAKSLIVFSAKSSNADAITITKIEINGLEQIDNGKTQLTISNNGAEPATAEWNKSYKAAADVIVPGIDNISYSVPVKAMDVTKKSSYLGIGGQGIMVPEQEMKSFTVYFEQKCPMGEPLEQSFTYNCQIGEEGDWEMGKRYIYELNFKVNELEVALSVAPWDDSAEGSAQMDVLEAASFEATTASAGEEFSLPTMTLTDGTKVIIDWADGATPDEYIYAETKATPIEVGEDGILDASHTYTAAGTYPVKIYVSENGHVDMGELDKSIYDLITVKIPERFSVKSNIPDGNIHFEDPLFKAYCVENFDQDGDGEVSFSEARGVTDMEFDTNGMDNLVGIEHFLDLETLVCELDYYYEEKGDDDLIHFYDEEGNEIFGITYLDVSHNTLLQILDVNCNRLNHININNNTKLTVFACYGNHLKSLDMSDNPALTGVSIGGNLFYNVDLRDNTKLSILNCNNGQLESLDISKNTELTYLECDNNWLESLDISKHTKLTYLNCEHNRIKSLDVKNLTQLESLWCGSNQISSLDVENLTQLETLWCGNNQITTLDVSNNLLLESLHCKPMDTLTTLYMAEGQEISHLSKPETTVIEYK